MNKFFLVSSVLLYISCLEACQTKKSNTDNLKPTTEVETYARVESAVGNIGYANNGDLIYSNHPFYKPKIRVMRYHQMTKTSSPFPSLAWNTENPNDENHYLSSVLGIRNDRDGVVWMLDMGFRNGITPKLVGWDTKTNSLVKIYKIPAPASGSTSQLNDFTIDDEHGVFIIADEDIGPGGDGSKGALIVVDRKTGKSRRLLEGHYSTRPENKPIIVGGKPINKPNTQQPILVGADGIVADINNKWLYYAPLNGSKVYRIKIEDLLNKSLTKEQLARQVETYANKENNGGFSIDVANNLYLTYIESKSIGIIPANGKQSYHYAIHENMVWPDGISYNKDGYMYVSASQISKAAPFNQGHDKTKKPYFIFRFKPIREGIWGR